MSRHRAIEQAVREERLSAIRRCRHCDPCGWRLGVDDTPIDPAVRCAHSTPTPPAVRDTSEPIHVHEPDLFTEPTHERNP